MTALDSCEPQIIRALEKDGWIIVAKPHYIPLQRRTLYADFRIRHTDEDGEHYAVVIEVKCFLDPQNDVPEIYRAMGQYHLYRTSLAAANQPYPLYLALPADAYHRFLDEPEVIEALRLLDVQLVIVDLSEEIVLEWKHWQTS